MKAKIILALLYLSISSSTVYSQTDSKSVIVTLLVNTKDINESNLATSCSFGQDSRISNEEYTIEIDLNDTVLWLGKSTSDPTNESIKIKEIIHEDGTQMFDSSIIPSKGQSNFIEAVAINGEPGDIEKYTISFQIIKNGQVQEQVYSIDPKIRIRIRN